MPSDYNCTAVDIYPTHVISHTLKGSHGHLIRLPMLFPFKPGQVAGLTLNDTIPVRIYSIAGSDFKNWIEFLFDVKSQGVLTPKLAELKAGDRIFMSKPFGTFVADERPAYWIAAGTGVAPFKIMADAGLYVNKYLIHGVGESKDFYFREYFEETLGENYIKCCSRDNSKDCFKGRVTDYIEQLSALPADINYYLCGSAEMVIETRDLLISKGISFENIIAEIYF